MIFQIETDFDLIVLRAMDLEPERLFGVHDASNEQLPLALATTLAEAELARDALDSLFDDRQFLVSVPLKQRS